MSTSIVLRPARGYPDQERTLGDCIGVVMDEEIELYRFALRDLAVLEASQPVHVRCRLPAFRP